MPVGFFLMILEARCGHLDISRRPIREIQFKDQIATDSRGAHFSW